MSKTAKLFRNGNSQAVRLPQEFRFPGGEVRIRREGDTVVLEPIITQHQRMVRRDRTATPVPMPSKATGAISARRAKQARSRKLMDYLLDTNACVAILRNKPPSVRNHADSGDGRMAHAWRFRRSFSHELWYGTYKSTRVDEGMWQFRIFLAGGIRVLEFDDDDARISGTIRAELAKSGELIGEYDTLIGGQCLRYGMTLRHEQPGGVHPNSRAGLRGLDQVVCATAVDAASAPQPRSEFPANPARREHPPTLWD